MTKSTKAKHKPKKAVRKVKSSGSYNKLHLSIFAVMFSLLGSYIVLNTFAESLDYQAQPFSMDYIETSIGRTNLLVGGSIAALVVFVILVGPSKLLKPFRAPVRGFATDPSLKPTVMPRGSFLPKVSKRAAPAAAVQAPNSAPVKAIPTPPKTAPAPAPVSAPAPKSASLPHRETGLMPGTTVLPTEGRRED